jgi:excinuclease ABC subunit A
VDYIKGLSPAVAIEQKVKSRNPRSTVGTSTEIYEYIKLLFARVGKTYSPISGVEVKRHSVSDVVDYVCRLNDNVRVMVLFPVSTTDFEAVSGYLNLLVVQGYTRMRTNNTVLKIEEFLQQKKISKNSSLGIVVDRITVRQCDTDMRSRLADSVQTAFYEGHGVCTLLIEADDKTPEEIEFSNKFEADGITFVKPSPNFFSFNNPYGACVRCEGFGSVIGIDEDLVIPNKSLSLYENAVACWVGEKLSEWKNEFILKAYKYHFPVHTPYNELTVDQKKLLWDGNGDIEGINDFFAFAEKQSYKIQYRIIIARYRGKTTCPDCHGTRLRKDAAYVKINDKSIVDIVLMPVSKLITFFDTLEFSPQDLKIARRLLVEVQSRLAFLNDAGLGYLTLNRLSNSLSGGESQRINLSTSLGNTLTGSMYILDEPSIGLHPRDTDRLTSIIERLRNIGNTVVVVEHDEEIISRADNIVDIGPMAGQFGGEVVFQGSYSKLIKANTLTSKYLNGTLQIEIPKIRRSWKEFVLIKGATENNLKNLNVKIPLGVIAVVTGVSGSGKTSLIRRILFHAIKKELTGYGEKPGKHLGIVFDKRIIQHIELVDQNPIGKSSRSNPATYLKIFDDVRTLFSDEKLSVIRNYKPGFFSFNVPGGRCEECEGEGEVTINMQFMADIKLKCESCGGKRFKNEILEVKHFGKTIAEILEMTIEEAMAFFSSLPSKTIYERILNKLQPMLDVGLGYLSLGQSSSSLSGGEAQRIKLASFLTKGFNEAPHLFIFDEPSIGLHFHDISKLMVAFEQLVNNGHSIVIVEHNLDIIKCADWIIDLGPEGGEEGGYIIFEGSPEQLSTCKESHTGMYLKKKLLN